MQAQVASHKTKLAKVLTLATWFAGDRTHAAIMAQVPEAVIVECPARIVAAVAAAIDKAYHAGRASTKAEVVDDAIWVEPAQKLIPIAALQAMTIDKHLEAHPDPRFAGLSQTITRYQLEYIERV